MTASRRLWIAVTSATLAAVFALSFTRITSPDLGFLLATGRAVLALGRIPATNVLSFTEPDHPWILHEWLPSVLFALAWQRFGPAGVLAVKIAVVVATWLTVLATARRLGASPLAAGVATLLGAGAAAMRFSERPQIFSGLGLAVTALLLARAGAEAGPRRLRLVVAAGLAGALGLQVHAGALTSFALMLAVAAGLALESFRTAPAQTSPPNPPLPPGEGGSEGAAPPSPLGERGAGGVRSAQRAAAQLAAVALGGIALAALALALYHPHGARPLLVPFQLGADADLHEHVVEYRSPLEFSFGDVHLYWVLAAVVVAAVGARARHLSAALLVPVAAFAALSLRHVRTVDAFGIVAAPVLALSLDGLLGARVQDRRVVAAGLGVTALLAVGLPLDHWRVYPPGAGIAEAVWPARMFRFIEEQHLTGPAFVSDGWAGPYLGVFYPRERAFFDPRFEAYSPAFVREVYRSIRYGEEGAEEKLTRYGVDVVLLKYTTPRERELQGGRDNLRQILARSPAWALVGFGDTGELFVRRTGAHAAVAERLAIPGVDPDRGVFLARPRGAAVPLLQALERGFHDNRVLVLAAVAVADGGDRALAGALLDRADAQRPGDLRVHEARRLLGP